MNGGGWKTVPGGWDGAWTQTYQSGPPVTVTFAGSPYNYLPGESRPNQILPDAQAQPSGWDIGPDRFPFSAQNRYYNFDAFAYPAPFTPGLWAATRSNLPDCDGRRCRFRSNFRSPNERNSSFGGISII